MRYTEFATTLVEAVAQNPKLQAGTSLPDTMIDRDTIIGLLNQGGYHNIKPVSGTKIEILLDIPEGSPVKKLRKDAMDNALEILKKGAPKSEPRWVATNSSQGAIAFGDGCPVKIEVKDAGKKGDKSAGVKNEENLRSMLQILLMEYGKINVTFIDSRGKKISIKNCDNVVDASKDTAARKKADLVLSSSNGSLPISLKQLDAESWESGDSLFGPKANVIVKKLLQKKLVTLIPTKVVQTRKGDKQYYALSKEIVVEPTEQDAMNAIFGSDLMTKGGVAIQTFKDEHFSMSGNNVTINCDYVITEKKDIPDSHLMVWLIRNDPSRGSDDSGVGIPGVRVLGSVLTRAIGAKGLKDVILVDVNGNVIDNPNQAAIDDAQHKKSINKSARDYKGASAVGRA